MARTVGIGHQDFETIRRERYFYIDKTDLIRQWWESGDDVTLVTRPRRFGKTLNISDLNNLEVVTTTSEKYSDCFGFTEEEVFAALEEYGLADQKQKVKDWYDGFSFGNMEDIYNPWSIINFLDDRKVGAYWANTSANRLVEKLLREGKPKVKQAFEELLEGGTLHMVIDEQIIYDQLSTKKNAIWSLLLPSGY